MLKCSTKCAANAAPGILYTSLCIFTIQILVNIVEAFGLVPRAGIHNFYCYFHQSGRGGEEQMHVLFLISSELHLFPATNAVTVVANNSLL